ncbi:mandelate racemase/muconate lactonizing enzyme family protein [Microbacterium trichothecenolyticum]|uniref:mandelate racemase/muconate lactonizing enzyme family protein n=1 Tax=Microbacterium trichothecenolyticum TaxID=69370 RepID=UPI0035BE4453
MNQTDELNLYPRLGVPIIVDRVETFLIRLTSDGEPTRREPTLRTIFGRGTLYSDLVETLLVRIQSRDGAVGWGEALAPVGARAVAGAINDGVASLVIGQDAGRIRANLARMQESMRERGHLGGLYADAIAAIDIALWDLVGQTHGLSVSAMLGGAFRERIPTYVSSIAGEDDDERAGTISALAEEGAHSFKLHLGHGVAADLASFERLSSAAPGCRFAVDVHGVYTLPEAHSLAAGLADRGAWFLESALPPDAMDDFARLSSRSSLPIAAGEAFRNRFEVASWLSRDALSIYQPDTGRTGITEAANIAVMTSASGRQLMPHHSIALAPALAAGMHVAATAQLMPAFEYQIAAVRNANSLITAPLDVSPAEANVPNGPGLGIELREDAIRDIAISG